MQTIVLIDLENIQNAPLASIGADVRVFIFVGRTQNSIPFEVTRDAHQLGNRLEWIKIEGDGRNNLDFHLAFHLGRLSNGNPNAEFLVLSKDKGFDPLIKHLVGKNIRCERIEAMTQAGETKTSGADVHFEKAFKNLTHIGKNARPRKRKTLVTQVASFFQKKESPEEVERIVECFFSKGLVSEANGALTYHF